MDKIRIEEIRHKLIEHRNAVSNILKSFNKHQNFPQEAKDELASSQTKLNEVIEILDEESGKPV